VAALLYTDVHVPLAVTSGLRRCGIDVLTSQRDGTIELPDEELLSRATDLDRVLLTQDTDFLMITANWQENKTQFRAVIFVRQIGMGIGEIIEDINLLLTAANDTELWNQVYHLPLR